jgi:replicative DNA helicase
MMFRNADSIEYQVPYNEDAERALLGSLLISPDIYNDVRGSVVANDFYVHKNRWVFEAIASLIERKSAVDHVTICEELESGGRLQELGGVGYMTQLVSSAPNSTHAGDYAKIIKENSIRRQMLVTSNNLANLAYNTELSQDEVQDSFNKSIEDVRKSFGGADTVISAVDVGLRFNEHLYDKRDPILFHLKELDSKTGGIDKRTNTGIMGVTGKGKSTFCFQMARDNANAGRKVLYFCIEQTAELLWQKVACEDYDFRKIKLGIAKPEDLEKIGRRTGELIAKYKDNLLFNESSVLSVNDIWSCVSQHKPEIVVVDHLGLIEYSGEKDEWKKLGAISWAMKQIAKELDCAMFSVVQVNRPGAMTDEMPQLSHVDGSWRIIQNVDQMLILHRKDATNDLPITAIAETKVKVGKYRDGVSNTSVTLKFIPAKQRFFDKDTMI